MCSLMLTNVPAVTSARNRDFPCLITEMSSSSFVNFSESIRQSWKWLFEFYFTRYSENFQSSYFYYCNIFIFLYVHAWLPSAMHAQASRFINRHMCVKILHYTQYM